MRYENLKPGDRIGVSREAMQTIRAVAPVDAHIAVFFTNGNRWLMPKRGFVEHFWRGVGSDIKIHRSDVRPGDVIRWEDGACREVKWCDEVYFQPALDCVWIQMPEIVTLIHRDGRT